MGINWADIIVTSDGGYALTASAFNNYDGMFVKLRHDLSVEFIQEYPDSVNLVEFYNSIVELPDGYLLGGYLQRPNYLLDAFLRRVDKQGNSVWFTYFGEYDISDTFSNYYKENDSTVVYVGGYITNNSTLMGRGPWVVFVNPEDGEIISEWRPTNSPVEYLHYIYPLPGNKWLLYGKKAFQANPTLARSFWALTDSVFNLENMKVFGPSMFITSFLWDFKPTLDDNFIAVGQRNADNPNNEPDVYGWLYKVSPDLDSLWSLQLTAPIPNVQQSGNYLGGVGVLSSGNMVAGGYAQSGNDIRCWLVKFSPDGCVDTIWCVTTPAWEPVEVEMQEAGLLLWPNPTAGAVNLRLPEPNTNFHGFLYDVLGRLVSTFEIPSGPGQSDYFLEMSYLTPGAYQVVLRDGKGRFWREKVVKY